MAGGGLLVLLWIVGIAIGAGVGAWIAGQKQREAWEGALLGLFLGPIGWIIEALLPGGPELPPGVVGEPSGPRTWDAPVPRRVTTVGSLSGSTPAPGPAMAAASSPTGRAMKRCPQCAEDVLEEARICRYCRYSFPEVDVAVAAVASPPSEPPAPVGPTPADAPAPPLAWPEGDWITQPEWSPTGFYVVESVAPRERLPGLLGGMLTAGTRLNVTPREDGSWVETDRGAATLVAPSHGGVVWATSSRHRGSVALATLQDELLAILRSAA